MALLTTTITIYFGNDIVEGIYEVGYFVYLTAAVLISSPGYVFVLYSRILQAVLGLLGGSYYDYIMLALKYIIADIPIYLLIVLY